MNASAGDAPDPSAARIARALVVGASGHVGRAVVVDLRSKKIPVIAHVRFDSARLEHWRARFASSGAELSTARWDKPAFEELVRTPAVSHVFLCLGTTLRRRVAGSNSSVKDNYAAVDYGLSALVIDACVQSGVRPHVTLLSAAGARAGARSSYLSARGRLEDYLQASGLEFTIARPGIISGPGRDEFRVFEYLAGALLNWGLLWSAFLGMQLLRERYRTIDAQELAKALVWHAQDPLSRGRRLMGERLRAFP